MKSKTNRTYAVVFAEDVPHYGTTEIEADDDQTALESAERFDISSVTHDPDWQDTVCRRIVSIESPDGEVIAEDIRLDNAFLRYGGAEDRRLCDAATDLLAVLRRIAAIPLWGESIPAGDLRRDYALAGEYDLEEDGFNPSCDTESTQLQDAVEDARAAIAAFAKSQLGD